ncbi:hypothetical protein GIB67_017383 [Kingdonia uniflora]|uniref:Uncharacterized protein n=1 Tax=Kingdonia uniflora TaxID=39325 RepID=A0A7J7M4A5_9MAGN|nr:hypothetical protein GIB67_017383 [Kingdonia uniflora]
MRLVLEKMTLKLMVSKPRNEVLYAEDGADFGDFIFSILTLPLGSVIKILGGNTNMGCIDNLYKSTVCEKSEVSREIFDKPHAEDSGRRSSGKPDFKFVYVHKGSSLNLTFPSISEQRWRYLRILADDKVEETDLGAGVSARQYRRYYAQDWILREFCKSKALAEGIWGNVIEHAGRQFRGYTVEFGEENLFFLPDLEKEKMDWGVDELISLEYFDGNVQGNLDEGFLCYLSQLEYRLSLPLSNLAKDVQESTTSSKLSHKFPKKRVVMRGSASGTTGSDEIEGDVKKMRVDPPAKLIRAARLLKGICLKIEDEKAELENRKVELEKKVARLKSDLVWEGRRLDYVKAAQEAQICERTEEAQKNLDKVGTYVEGDEVEGDVIGVVGELDGVSPQTELENQGDDNENPENDNEKATEDREDQHVKVHFKFVEAAQTVDDLTRKIEGKDTEIERGQRDLTEANEEAAKLNSQNDVLMVKSKETDMARYRIQSLEIAKKELRGSVASLKGQMNKKTRMSKNRLELI